MRTFEKVVFYFIIIQPLLDIATSFMTVSQVPITIGAGFRALIIIFLFVFITLFLIINKWYSYFLMWTCSFIVISITFITNYFVKQPFYFFEEINFILKTTYYIVFAFSTLIIIRKNVNMANIIYRSIPIVSIIIGTSFWIAFITKTNISSYAYDKAGYSGWFFSANELSSIVLILLSLTIAHLHETNKQNTIIHFIALCFLLSMLPMIGTKTAFSGGLLIVGAYILYLLFFAKRNSINIRFKLIFLIIISLFFIMIPFTPISTNTTSVELNDNYLQLKRPDNYDQMITHPVLNRILSSRDIYFKKTANDFFHLSMTRQLFGLGYGGNYTTEPKLIEMDFFDLLFSYGYIGFLILIMPLIKLNHLSLTRNKSISLIILQLTILLLLAIAFLAGHILFAPAVMTYLFILFLQSTQIHKVNLDER